MAQQSAAGLCTHCIIKNGTVANEFVDRVFFDCLYRPAHWVGFAFQLVSISAWIVAQVPQFIDNWRNGSADALSPIFLADWLLGDSSNLVGCILTGTQLPLTTGTAWYFVGCDIIMIVQYIYYAASNANKRRRSLQQQKRQLIQNAATVGEQHLLDYASYNGEVRHGSAWEQHKPHAIHSSPNLQSMADRGWQVHAIEGASPNQLQVPAVAPGEASTSNDPNPHQPVSLSVPLDPAVAGAQAGMSVTSVKLIRIAVIGIAVAAALLVVMLWVLQSGQHRAMHSSLKGLIPRSYDAWACDESAKGSEGSMEPAGCTGMHADTAESGSLPLCPDKHLPKWTKTFGLVVGYFSVFAYLKSRVAQLIQNFTRGNADGLSASMFVCAITANVTGSTGIIIRLESRSELFWQLPWLMGQLGTAGMDVLIALQASQSARRGRNGPDSMTCQQDSRSDLQGCSVDAVPDDSDQPLLPHTPTS